MDVGCPSTSKVLLQVLWSLQKTLFSLEHEEEEEEEECRSLLRHVMRISSRKYSCSHTEEKAYRSSELPPSLKPQEVI